MTFNVEHLPEPIAKRLRSYYRRKVMYSFLRILLGTAVVIGVLALIVMHIDRFLFLPLRARSWLVYGVWIIGALYAGAGVVRLFFYGPSPRDIAYEMEAELPDEVEERYVSLEDVLRPDSVALDDEANPDMLEKLQESTIAHSHGVDAGSLVSDRKGRRLFRGCLVMGLIYALLFLPASYEFDLMVKRFLRPHTPMRKPSFVKLTVSPGDAVLGKGDDMVIQAETTGSLPAPMEWVMDSLGVDPDGCYLARGEDIEEPFRSSRGKTSEMSRVRRDLFVHTATDLDSTFSYRIRYGDAQTDVWNVNVVEQPEVVGLNVKIDPPEQYDTVESRDITSVRDKIKALKGSSVTIEFGTDRPVEKQLVVIDGEDEPQPAEPIDGGERFKYEFELEETLKLAVKVVDEEGFANVNKPQITFVPQEDQDPDVQLDYPSGEVRKVPAEIVPIQATVQDDIGVTDVSISYRVNPDREEKKPETEEVSLDESPVQKVDISPVLDLGDIGVVPGDEVLLRLVAKDSGGNYGESRAVSVQIVPFTRGTNEHKRIEALQFVADALKLIEESGEGGEGFAIDKSVYSKIEEEAGTADVEVGEERSVRSLLDMLEKEQYFTGIPYYKQDVRRIYGVLYGICARSQDGDIEDRREAFGELAEDVIMPMVNYRRVKNLTWRLFGMRYEATNIGDTLAGLAEEEDPPAGSRDSIKRRAELYLESLQDMGREAIRLSRRAQTLKTEDVEGVVEELNTAGYYMKRGSLEARSESCGEVRANIPEIIRITQESIPDMQEKDGAGRDVLEKRYRTSVESLNEEQQADWMASDAAMMQWNPFAPVWPQYLRFAVMKETGEDEDTVRSLMDQIAAPPGAEDAAVRWEERNMTRMSYRVRMDSILSRQELSRLEKGLVLRTMRLEWSSRFGDGEELKADEERESILELTDESAPSEEELADLQTVFMPPKQTPIEQSRKLMDKAEETYSLASPGEMTEDVLLKMKEVDEGIDNASDVMDSGESDDIQKEIQRLITQVNAEKRLLESVPRGLWLRLTLFNPDVDEAVAMEQLLLKFRDYTGQYVGRLERSLRSIDNLSGGEDADELERGRLGAEVETLRAIHSATQEKIEALKETHEERGEDNGKEPQESGTSYALMDVFNRTRKYVNTSEELTQSRSPEELAREFVKEFPQAGVAYLKENEVLVQAANEEIGNARTIIETEPGEVEKFEATVARAAEQIETFETIVKRATTEESRSEIMTPLNELRGRLNKISPENDRKIGEKAKFSLSEAERAGRALLGQLGLITREVRDDAVQYRGGPEDVDQETYWRDVDGMRTRLRDWGQTSRGIIMGGVLEPLRSAPDRRSYTGAWNWSRFLYRLVRSELCQGEKEREDEGGDEDQDTWLEFLTDELNDAAREGELEHYERTAQKYLDLAKSYLRY